MSPHGRAARSRRKFGFTPWFGIAGAVALCAPLGCAEYQPSMEPGDDVAGLQADAGASGMSHGGAAGLASGGRAGAGTAGAQSMPAGGSSAAAGASAAGSSSGGAAAGGAAGALSGQAGAATSAGAGGAPAAGAGGAPAAGSPGAGAGNTAGSGSAGASSTPAVILSQGKPVTASTEQVGNEAPRGNDTDGTTRWCAVKGTFPQWWRVDLGAKHKLSDFSVKFEHGERKYSYKIETSNDDAVYTLQSTISGTGDVQSDTFTSGVSARYVRITVTAADSYVNGTTTYPTWASFWDFTVNGW